MDVAKLSLEDQITVKQATEAAEALRGYELADVLKDKQTELDEKRSDELTAEAQEMDLYD